MENLRIDIVSDVSCPWCIIGFKALDQALISLAEDISADIHWQPFELNPNMPEQGQDINEHLTQKYGISLEQAETNRDMIKQRGLSVGYAFGHRGGGRIYNTFDAHRLLHWASEHDKQTPLKLAFFDLYFKEKGNPSDHSQLLDKVESVGLHKANAAEILASDRYTQDVRAAQQHFQSLGIQSVPAVIINNKHLISGGQPPEVFKQALQQIAAEQNA